MPACEQALKVKLEWGEMRACTIQFWNGRLLVQFWHIFQISLVVLIINCTPSRVITYTNVLYFYLVILLNILSDLSTIQFRLTFKGHKSLECCCLVISNIHLTSVSTISYAESSGGIFVLTCIKPETIKVQQKVNRVSPRLIGKKTFLEKRNSENMKGIFCERLIFQKPWIAGIEIHFEINKFRARAAGGSTTVLTSVK
jgi:hypothetical protein